MDTGMKIQVDVSSPQPIRLKFSDGSFYNMSVETVKDVIGYLEHAVKDCEERKERKTCVPVWRKAKAGTSLPGDSVIRYKDDDPRFGRVAIRDCEYITIADLNALPTEERQEVPALVNGKTKEPYCKTNAEELQRLFGMDKEKLGGLCELLMQGWTLIAPGAAEIKVDETEGKKIKIIKIVTDEVHNH